MNINEFKAKMDEYGGPARNNIFVVELYATNSDYMTSSDLRMFCKTAVMPGIEATTMEYKPNNIGLSQQMPTGVTTTPVSCIFMLDSQHQVLSFFHEWMQNIVNYDMSGGSLAPNARDAEQLPYEIGYKKDYSMRMSIKMYSSHDKDSYYECILEDVFPTSIGSVELSWEANDQPATLAVAFSYSSVKMSGTNIGQIQNRYSRGIGILEYLTTLYAVGQTVSSIQKPNTVQEAVNSLTKVNNVFSQVSNLIK
jgi:hypothetical protein